MQRREARATVESGLTWSELKDGLRTARGADIDWSKRSKGDKKISNGAQFNAFCSAVAEMNDTDLLNVDKKSARLADKIIWSIGEDLGIKFAPAPPKSKKVKHEEPIAVDLIR